MVIKFCALWWGGGHKAARGRSECGIPGFMVRESGTLTQTSQGLTRTGDHPQWASLLTPTEALRSPQLPASWLILSMTLHLIISASSFMVQAHLVRTWMTKIMRLGDQRAFCIW